MQAENFSRTLPANGVYDSGCISMRSMQHCPFFYYSMTGKVVQDTNTDFVEFFERKGDCADSCKICLPALCAAVLTNLRKSATLNISQSKNYVLQ